MVSLASEHCAFPPLINDSSRTSEERIAALRSYLTEKAPSFPEFVPESNNHIHTCFSFSPYTPTAAALAARRAGLAVVGSVDHDSIAAAAEMTHATALLGMASVTGCEVRARISEDPHSPLAHKKLNNPDSEGVAYMTIQGVPERSRQALDAWLAPKREARLKRTLAMAEQANVILEKTGARPFDPYIDMVGISQFHRAGGITERHLLAAFAHAALASWGKGAALLSRLEEIGVPLSPTLRERLGDENNPYVEYDLLGVLKAEYLSSFYIQPSEELPSVSQVIEFADSLGAIAAYAYLGDVAQSPTGDKKAEHFEDSYLPELFDALADMGLRAVTYMPPRNTPEQISRIHEYASRYGMLEISGVDINQPRQLFTCVELRDASYTHLNEATWALVAHEVAANIDPRLSLVHSGEEARLTSSQLVQRVALFAPLGRAYARRELSAQEIADRLRESVS